MPKQRKKNTTERWRDAVAAGACDMTTYKGMVDHVVTTNTTANTYNLGDFDPSRLPK